MGPETVLLIANTHDTRHLLQGELRAIQQGLQFVENMELIRPTYKGIYRGYVNSDGQREGVGVTIWDDGEKQYAEYHNDQVHGLGLTKFASGNSYLGEHKHGDYHGYGTMHWAYNGQTYTGQWKDDKRNGYGVDTWPDGGPHYGQHKDGKWEGYGLHKYPDGNEYDGQWENDKRSGEGVYKYAATGVIQRQQWKDGVKIKVIEALNK
jgi:hypothetical protein